MVDLVARNRASQASLEHLEGARAVILPSGTTKGDIIKILESALTVALQSGATKNDIVAMIELKVAEHESTIQAHSTVIQDQHQEPVYSELPEGFIDIPTAVKKYGLKARTVHDWVRSGHVQLRGRLRAPTSGGGYLVVHGNELMSFIAAPRAKGGRPRKST